MDSFSEVPMPKLSPVRIITQGLPWWKKTIRYFARRRWEIIEDYYLYIPDLDVILLIPKGFIFDAASVPRILWPIINPTGILMIGSIFHDFGYKYNCLLDKDRNVIYNHEKNQRRFFDSQLRDINIYINGVNFMNKTAWLAIKVFGIFSWSKYRLVNSIVSEVFEIAIKPLTNDI